MVMMCCWNAAADGGGNYFPRRRRLCRHDSNLVNKTHHNARLFSVNSQTLTTRAYIQSGLQQWQKLYRHCTAEMQVYAPLQQCANSTSLCACISIDCTNFMALLFTSSLLRHDVLSSSVCALSGWFVRSLVRLYVKFTTWTWVVINARCDFSLLEKGQLSRNLAQMFRIIL